MGLHNLFRESVQKNPEATAIVFGDLTMTYRKLDQLSDHYANFLIKHGVGKDVLVGMCFNRNMEMIIAMLSIVKAGGVYVPIDPTYPESRRNYIVKDSGMNHILVEASTASLFEESNLEQLTIESDYSELDTLTKEHLNDVDFQGAYVIYTSGTTGDPKGVLIDHSNVIRLFKQTEHLFDFKPTDRWSFFHSISFDFSVWEIWGPLLYGAELIIVPYTISRSPARFYELVADKGVTVMNQTPSAFRSFVAENKTNKSANLNLRYVIFGGEKLESTLVSQWMESNGDEKPELINMYGITETTVHVTFKKLTKEELPNSHICSIGKPISDLEVYLFDDHGNKVPEGGVGEMFIAGPGVARGYFNKPELTEQKFVLKTIDGQQLRFYRSGDMAKRDQDGSLQFVGRIDDQIKLNGFRIEPKEIESIACEIEGVLDSKVIKVEYSDEDQRLVNFVLVSTQIDASQKSTLQDNLGAAFKDKVPSYMRPHESVFLHEYPQTPNGKLDQKKMTQDYLDLLNRDKETSSMDSGSIAERCEWIWKEILEVEEVDETIDFFDLGGTSLSLIQLLSDTKKTFGVELNMGRFHNGVFLSAYISEVHRALSLTIWNSIIEDFQEGVDDDKDFFDLGGTSLSLIQLINETSELLFISLKMSNFSDGISFQSYLSEIEKSHKPITAITK